MLNTASGAPSSHSVSYFGAGGMSAGLPSGPPALPQATSVALSFSDSRRSLTNSPCDGSACHGGIAPFPTCVAIDFAHGRASLYVRSDIGAISPGRWQLVQFLYRMGATSLLNVGVAGACAPNDVDDAMTA